MQETLTLLLTLLGCCVTVHAQRGENLYAAPGMPVIITHKVTVEAVPAAKPWLTQPLPRFWKNADSLRRQQGSAQLRQAIAQRLHYSKLALLSQLSGSVKVRLIIGPSGAPLVVNIVDSVFAVAVPDRKASEALQAEAMKIAQLLRFQPDTGRNDTVAIPFSYYFDTGQ